MNNIKYLFLLLLVVLFTGCTVKYDLNIDEDLSITEKVEATENEYDLKTNTGMNSDKAVDYLYNIFKRDGIQPSISSKLEGDNLIAVASVSHKSINDYVDNFSSDIFKKAKLSKSGNIYSLSFNQTEKLSKLDSSSLIYDNISVNITIPFKVISSNADNVYKNTYTWNLKKGEELRKIKIKFDTSEKNNSKIFDFGLFKINIKYSVLIYLCFILLIATTIIVVYLNNKKNNKL